MYSKVGRVLHGAARRWSITGVAGFIGSNLLEELLLLDQYVVGLDNFCTSSYSNLEEVRATVSEAQWSRFRFIEGDIRDPADCSSLCAGADVVLHQAALGSVPRSILDPISTHSTNLTGFLNMLMAAKAANIERFVFAASSSTYGDHPGLPKVEERIGNPLSPYAVTKLCNELYAAVFSRVYGIQTVGLRYFNVFGPRQNPNGEYAAVIPKWIKALRDGQKVQIFGDGESSRDFCYVKNVVQANLLAASCSLQSKTGDVFNVAVGERTTLNELFQMLRDGLAQFGVNCGAATPNYAAFRAGDIRHSHADISKAARDLGYRPSHAIKAGLAETLAWYVGRK